MIGSNLCNTRSSKNIFKKGENNEKSYKYYKRYSKGIGVFAHLCTDVSHFGRATDASYFLVQLVGSALKGGKTIMKKNLFRLFKIIIGLGLVAIGYKMISYASDFVVIGLLVFLLVSLFMFNIIGVITDDVPPPFWDQDVQSRIAKNERQEELIRKRELAEKEE